MTLTVFFAVLAAAVMHAGWNAAIKRGGDKVQGMLLLTYGHAILGLILAPFFGLPSAQALPWLAASVLIHAAYQTFLAIALTHGDLSRVYPISRGSAPLMVLIYGFFFLPDVITAAEVLGVLLLGAGIFTMARGIFTSGENRKMLPFALGAACATAGYTIADGQGARVQGNAGVYIVWLFILSAVVFTPVCVAMRGMAVFRIPRPALIPGLLAGVFSCLSYWIAVWAMTQAPIALVAALRETSILFAVILGVTFFGDRFDVRKGVAAVLIVAGAVVTRL